MIIAGLPTKYLVYSSILFSFIFLRPGQISYAQGMVYHVSETGNDENPGTLELPWLTIGKANETLVAGDTVYLHTGSYTDPIRPQNSGTSNEERITYRAFGDGDVTIEAFPGTGGPDEGALALGERNYITVSGRAPGDPETALRIRLRPSQYINSFGNVCGSEGVVIENVEMIPRPGGVPGRGFAFCLNFWDETSDTRYNVLRNSYLIGVSSDALDPLTYTEDVVTLSGGAHHNLIENNIIESAKHTALYADSPTSHSNVIRNNIIRNPQHTALSIWSAGVALSRGARFLVEGNLLEASGDTNEPHGSGGNAFQWGADELIIRYNVITQGGASDRSSQKASTGGLTGATSTSFGAPYFATDGRIYNNSIVKNRGVAIGMFDFGEDPVDLGRHIFLNNFVYGSRSFRTDETLVLYWDEQMQTSDRYISNVFGNPGGSSDQAIISTGHHASASLSSAASIFVSPRDPSFDIEGMYPNLFDSDPGFTDYGGSDYTLPETNPYNELGAPVTSVTSAGSGTRLPISDTRFFFAEAADFPSWMGVQHEEIVVGENLQEGERVKIIAIDEDAGELELERAISWNDADPVWIVTGSDGSPTAYGERPAIGAFDVEVRGLANESLLPETSLILDGGYPNPFSRSVTLSYHLPLDGEVKLQVFDVIGREVALLVEGRQRSGSHQVQWNAQDLPPGIYVCRLSTSTSRVNSLLVKQ